MSNTIYNLELRGCQITIVNTVAPRSVVSDASMLRAALRTCAALVTMAAG